jgi:nitrate reductase delta subunit
MAVCDTRSHVLTLLADLLEYPTPALPAKAAECRELVGGGSPRGAELLDAFIDELERTPSGRLEELYAAAFDFDLPTEAGLSCYPYVGHYLLGESYRRSRFMVGLLDRYREHGFDAPADELPDHVVTILRFLAHAPDSEAAEEVAGEALLPALARMTHEGRWDEDDGGRAIWFGVLEAVRLVLGEQLWPGTAVPSYPPVVAHGPARDDVSPRTGCAG